MRFLRVLLLRERVMTGSVFSWICVMISGEGRVIVWPRGGWGLSGLGVLWAA